MSTPRPDLLGQVKEALGELRADTTPEGGPVLVGADKQGRVTLIIGPPSDERVSDLRRHDREVAGEVAQRLAAVGLVVDADALADSKVVPVHRRAGAPAVGPVVKTWITPQMRDEVDARAAAAGVPRSEMLRRLIATGLGHPGGSSPA